MALPKKVQERLQDGLKRLLPVIEQQKTRDVSEADTVTLVKDILSDAFGYDKYAELTSEHAVRGTYCDLAIRVDGKLLMLIEVKSAGTSLDDRHVKQAIDYAANQGAEWVMLTNASHWRLYNVIFAKPIDKRLICEVDLSSVEIRKVSALECLYHLTRDGFLKGAHLDLKAQQEATSRYLLAALIVENDAVINTIRRELRRVVDVSVNETDIIAALKAEVLKRDTLEGPEAEAAHKRVKRIEARHAKTNKVTASSTSVASEQTGLGLDPQEVAAISNPSTLSTQDS